MWLTFWSQNIQFYSEISVIPHNSNIFGLHTGIDSNSVVSSSNIFGTNFHTIQGPPVVNLVLLLGIQTLTRPEKFQ